MVPVIWRSFSIMHGDHLGFREKNVVLAKNWWQIWNLHGWNSWKNVITFGSRWSGSKVYFSRWRPETWSRTCQCLRLTDDVQGHSVDVRTLARYISLPDVYFWHPGDRLGLYSCLVGYMFNFGVIEMSVDDVIMSLTSPGRPTDVKTAKSYHSKNVRYWRLQDVRIGRHQMTSEGCHVNVRNWLGWMGSDSDQTRDL